MKRGKDVGDQKRCVCCKARKALRFVVEAMEPRTLLSSISGTVFNDLNQNGLRDAGEPGLGGVGIYIDYNADGKYNTGEPVTTSDASGNYSFAVPAGRNFIVGQMVPSGFTATQPTGAPMVAANVNISRSAGNHAEVALAIDPSNSSRVFETSIIDIDGAMEAAYSADGGATWTRYRLADGTDGLPRVCCDPAVAWDAYGNLYASYMNADATQIIVLRSVDGGQSFSLMASLDSTSIDQSSLAVGPGQNGVGNTVWVTWNQDINATTDSIQVAGAQVTGLGTAGAFSAQVAVPGGNGSYGDIAVGPQGQVMVVYQQTNTGTGPSQIYTNVDPDGLGPLPFAAQGIPLTSNVGDYDYIPAQAHRSIDAETGLAWDRSGGLHDGRVYLVYTDAPAVGSADTNIFVKFSDDNGSTWSAGLQVNDDNTNRSQFLPRIAIDQTTGTVAVTWEDARNDPNNLNGQVFGAISTDGGQRFSANFQISAGASSGAAAGGAYDLGDYTALAFQSGTFMPGWADNSNSTGDNPNGTLQQLNVYTAMVTVPRAGQLAGNGTVGATNLNFADHQNVAALNATIAGRSIFYNNSFYDGTDATANALDDGAIAPDKTALLPGQTATFANYTSYDKGINGLMIDVNAPGNRQAIGASDFVFKVSINGSTWTAAPVPTSVTVRPSAGKGGSDRIEILFADYAITNEWLQVTVNSDANTGLATADVFYFGNLVGGTGQHNNIAIVNTTDIAIAKLANNTPATLASIADFNRNGLVNVTDVALAKLNNRHSIPLFTAPAPPPKPPAPAVARAPSAVGAAVFSTRVIPPSLKVEKPARKNKDMLA